MSKANPNALLIPGPNRIDPINQISNSINTTL